MTEDTKILLHCIHNALWMAEHQGDIPGSAHLAVLDLPQRHRAKELLRELMEPVST